MICVGTPSKKNGDLELDFIESVCREIGFVLRDKSTRHTIVVRSTVLPGTVANVVIPILEDCSGKKAGVDFGVAVNPEFLRESTAIADYDHPPMTVIGEFDVRRRSAVLAEELGAQIIRKDAPLPRWSCLQRMARQGHLRQQIGNIAKAVGVDGREVMDVVCQDKAEPVAVLHAPGFAFGGSCRRRTALTYRAGTLDVGALLNSLMQQRFPGSERFRHRSASKRK
jgi:GDP-mannose 6-dehydrogenase